MKPREAFTDSVGDITPPVLAAGGPGFPQALIGTLRRLANVGHCLVFSPVADGAVRRRLDIGNIAIGGARGLAYSERFHMADANRDAILSQAASAAPIALPTFAQRRYSNSYRKLFFVDSGSVDNLPPRSGLTAPASMSRQRRGGTLHLERKKGRADLEHRSAL